VVCSASARADDLQGQATGHDTLVRINDLIKAGLRTPFANMGAIKPLRSNLLGWWSRWSAGNTASSTA